MPVKQQSIDCSCYRSREHIISIICKLERIQICMFVCIKIKTGNFITVWKTVFLKMLIRIWNYSPMDGWFPLLFKTRSIKEVFCWQIWHKRMCIGAILILLAEREIPLIVVSFNNTLIFWIKQESNCIICSVKVVPIKVFRKSRYSCIK